MLQPARPAPSPLAGEGWGEGALAATSFAGAEALEETSTPLMRARIAATRGMQLPQPPEAPVHVLTSSTRVSPYARIASSMAVSSTSLQTQT